MPFSPTVNKLTDLLSAVGWIIFAVAHRYRSAMAKQPGHKSQAIMVLAGILVPRIQPLNEDVEIVFNSIVERRAHQFCVLD